MMLSGKGMWVWAVKRCGEPADIARDAKEAGFSHVLVKLADGPIAYYGGNWGDPFTRDWTKELVIALKAEGIDVIAWQYVYGANPAAEADMICRRMNSVGLKKLVVDAEKEYKAPDMGRKAVAYCQRLSTYIPDIQLGFSSYRYPSLHPEIPWAEFGQFMECYVPQVYWMGAHNPVEQLGRCLREYKKLPYPNIPIYPAGAAFREYGWQPNPGEITSFLKAAKEVYSLDAANLWEWYDAKIRIPDFWNEIVGFTWGGANPPPEMSIETKVNILWREAALRSWNLSV